MSKKPTTVAVAEPVPEALVIETIAVADLHADPANLRRHPERNLDAIKASLARFGQRRPILVDAAGIVRAGNGTLMAAKALGWETIACVRTSLTGSEATAYAIADNRTAELAIWDDTGLAETLRALQSEDFDLGAVGFTDDEVDEICKGLGDALTREAADNPGPQIDRADELREKWGTAPGQLWVVPSLMVPGKEHRLLCGDSTKADDVARVMGGEKATCVFTDPPYGVSVARKNQLLNENPSPAGGNTSGGRNTADIEDDDLSPEDLKARLLPAFALLRSTTMAEDCTLFVTSPQGGELCMMMMMMMMEAKLPARHVLIWKKNQATFSMGRLDYDYQHEPILMTWGKRHKRPMQGEHRTSVWEIDKPRKSAEHPTMKPPELYANAYLNNSDQGDIVADAYCGSGTAMVAAEQTGRLCRGIEIAPKYVAVALERLAGMGLEPRPA